MHIPDGMLSTATVAATGATSIGFVGYAVAWVKRNMHDGKVVLMAVMAALIFALQMLNFPVAGGTSGHFAGGAAAAILLGPWPAVIVMTTVLFIQALLFADGGILALGANVLNLAVIGPFVAYAVWGSLRKWTESTSGAAAVSFAAAWLAVVTSALAAGLEIWISGNAQLGLVLGAMGFWHALIGVGEGLITAGLVVYVMRARPDLLGESPDVTRKNVRGVAVTLGVVAVLAAGLSFLASSSPDGLEFVYFEEGIGAPVAEGTPLLSSPMPDYVVPGISNDTLAGILAGVIGLAITGVFLWTLISATKRRRRGETHG